MALKLREQLQTLQKELNFQEEQLVHINQHQDEEEEDQWRDASPDLEDDAKEYLEDGDDNNEEYEEEYLEKEIMKPSVTVASEHSNALVLRWRLLFPQNDFYATINWLKFWWWQEENNLWKKWTRYKTSQKF